MSFVCSQRVKALAAAVRKSFDGWKRHKNEIAIIAKKAVFLLLPKIGPKLLEEESPEKKLPILFQFFPLLIPPKLGVVW